MSRNDNGRRGNRHNWNNKDRNESNNRNERNGRGERNDRRGNDGHGDKRSEQNRHFANTVSQKEIQENENAIRAFKQNSPACELCGQPISDVANAISNKDNDNPVHFDCVLNKIVEAEKPGPNEKVTYIGQGKFAVLYFENVHDTRHFTIRRTIEWEERDKKRGPWRDEMAGLFSQVK
ncbi:MAG: hypothetical protein KBT11_03355 [Treponema sp.]|nr:hypothetical protein [Candidatus Treponema equifaecale]